MRVVVDNGPGRKRRTASARTLKSTRPEVSLRAATTADAAALHALIAAHLEEGRLLPRTLDELTVHAHRFVVATIASKSGGRLNEEASERIIGCAELAPLSATVAEVRSLVVSAEARKLGAGARMVEALNARARVEGYRRLVAFAHNPGFFVHRGFSIVPHTWVPEKIAHDCISCPMFRNCGQYAVIQEIVPAHVRANAQPGVRTRV